MLKSFLLPYGFRKIGWVILIPTALLGIVLLFSDFDADAVFRFFGLSVRTGSGSFTSNAQHWLNNIVLIGISIGGIFVACSKERIEDEMIARIRLNSLLTALYVNYAVLIVTALLVYDLAFITVMACMILGVLLLFILILRVALWRFRKSTGHEE